jgi:hypothetical protein
MKVKVSRIWRSPVICWSLCVLFTVLTIMWQLVDVKPYPGMRRDYLTGTVLFAAAAIAFLVLARRVAKHKMQ